MKKKFLGYVLLAAGALSVGLFCVPALQGGAGESVQAESVDPSPVPGEDMTGETDYYIVAGEDMDYSHDEIGYAPAGTMFPLCSVPGEDMTGEIDYYIVAGEDMDYSHDETIFVTPTPIP